MTTFISLGTGDKRHATLADLDIIKDATLVVVPGKRAEDIVKSLVPEAKVQRIDVPMSNDRKSAIIVYDEMVKLAEEREYKHQDTVIAVEGDVSIYASIHYVMDKLKADGYDVRQEPGVTSFITAASMAGISLISGNDRLLVVPGLFNSNDLKICDTLVIMKPKRSEKEIKEYLINNKDEYKAYYFENLDSPDAVFLSSPEEIIKREFPYFAMMIFHTSSR